MDKRFSFKNSILLLGCCLFVVGAFAQRLPKLYDLDTILYLKDLKMTRRVQDCITYNTSKTGMVCLYRIKKKFYLETIDFNTYKRKITKISNSFFNNQYFSSSSSFSIYHDSLIFINDTCMTGYDLKTKKIFLKKKVASIEYCRFDGQHVYYGRYYNYHPASKLANACVYSYNIRTGRLDSVILKTDFIEYTNYIPSHLISFSQTGFIYPAFGSNKVYIVNNKLDKTDSVSRDIKDWISPSKDLHQAISQKPENINTYFPLLDQENFEHIHRIEHVDYLDSNTFIVRWFRFDTTYKQRMRTIDVWHKNEKGAFTLKSSDQETIYPIYMDSLLSKYGMPLRSETAYTQYTSDFIIQVKSELVLNPLDFKTYREYLIYREKFGKKNEPVISIWIFKKN